MKKLQTKMQNHWLFSSNNFYICKCQKADEKKSKEDEQLLEELNSAHRRSQAKCRLIQTSYIKRIKLFLFSPYNKHRINRAKSVFMGESWPRSCVQTSLRSVCTYDLGQDSPIQTSSRSREFLNPASTRWCPKCLKERRLLPSADGSDSIRGD